MARSLVLGAALAGVVLCGCAKLDHNFRAVETDRLYRSGQVPHTRLAYFIQKNGIATVINLRGEDDSEDWYLRERAVCDGLGVAHHSLEWSMKRLPEPESLAQLVAWYREADAPVLVHCHGGVHRAAVASSVYVLLNGGGIDEAREELGLWFMGAGIGKLLDLYEGSGLPFDRWVEEEYPALYEAHEKKAA